MSNNRQKTNNEKKHGKQNLAKQERSEILKTMRILSQCGQLTPELSQQLMTAYYQPAILSC